MGPIEFEEKIKEIYANYPTDHEVSHDLATRLMCELLKSLGYEKGIKIFEESTRWYA